MPKSPKLFFKKKYVIPIYDCTVWVVVSDCIEDERDKMQDILGSWNKSEFEGITALCSSNRRDFALFFNREHICMDNIAHEAFHLTHRVLEWTNCNFDSEHHEQGALLHGYLMNLVYDEVIKFQEVKG